MAFGSSFALMLFAALNWRLSEPLAQIPVSLVPEAPVRSMDTGNVKFLDYLGIERQEGKPLLIVETKRPSSSFPSSPGTRQWTTREREHIVADRLASALAGKHLPGEWSRWLKSAKDYTKSVFARTGYIPQRVVLTNGKWLVIFENPKNAFLGDGKPDVALIHTFESIDSLLHRANDVFLLLEHQRVLGGTPPLTAGDVAFCIRGADVKSGMHGLRVCTSRVRGPYSTLVHALVAPVLILRTTTGAWLRVEDSSAQFEVPSKDTQLDDHLRDVSAAAGTLVSEVQRALGISLEMSPLSHHFKDADSFDTLPAVQTLARGEYLVLTGEYVHYLMRTPSVDSCPHYNAGMPQSPHDLPSLARSRLIHYCAHPQAFTARAGTVDATNRLRCGLRSARDGEAFCEIYGFERHLCCRACVYEKICLSADAFHLPCG